MKREIKWVKFEDELPPFHDKGYNVVTDNLLMCVEGWFGNNEVIMGIVSSDIDNFLFETGKIVDDCPECEVIINSETLKRELMTVSLYDQINTRGYGYHTSEFKCTDKIHKLLYWANINIPE